MRRNYAFVTIKPCFAANGTSAEDFAKEPFTFEANGNLQRKKREKRRREGAVHDHPHNDP